MSSVAISTASSSVGTSMSWRASSRSKGALKTQSARNPAWTCGASGSYDAAMTAADALAAVGFVAGAVQEAEFDVEQRRDLARAEYSGTRRCQLDGQGHPVELSDEAGDVDEGVVVDDRQRARPLGAVDEQLHRRR